VSRAARPEASAMSHDAVDIMELILEVEERLGVRLSHGDLRHTYTVGSLYLLILEQLGRDEHPRRQEALLLERLRRTLVELFGPPAGDVAPGTKLEEVIPRDQRRAQWRRLAAALGLPLPPLCRPAGLTHFLNGTSLGLFTLGIIGYLIEHPRGAVGWLVFTAFGLILVCFVKYRIVHFLTTPWAVCFPDEYATVRGLLRWLLLRDYGRILAQDAEWQDDEVWPALQEQLAKAFGVPREKITPDADFVRDLKVG
jgi:acyl carrier protein